MAGRRKSTWRARLELLESVSLESIAAELNARRLHALNERLAPGSAGRAARRKYSRLLAGGWPVLELPSDLRASADRMRRGLIALHGKIATQTSWSLNLRQLAEAMGAARNTAQRAIIDLEEAALIAVERRTARTPGPSRYMIGWANLAELAAAQGIQALLPWTHEEPAGGAPSRGTGPSSSVTGPPAVPSSNAPAGEAASRGNGGTEGGAPPSGGASQDGMWGAPQWDGGAPQWDGGAPQWDGGAPQTAGGIPPATPDGSTPVYARAGAGAGAQARAPSHPLEPFRDPPPPLKLSPAPPSAGAGEPPGGGRGGGGGDSGSGGGAARPSCDLVAALRELGLGAAHQALGDARAAGWTAAQIAELVRRCRERAVPGEDGRPVYPWAPGAVWWQLTRGVPGSAITIPECEPWRRAKAARDQRARLQREQARREAEAEERTAAPPLPDLSDAEIAALAEEVLTGAARRHWIHSGRRITPAVRTAIKHAVGRQSAAAEASRGEEGRSR